MARASSVIHCRRLSCGDTVPEGMLTPARLRRFWQNVSGLLEERLGEYRRKWESGTDEELFAELSFCLFTPQSKAVVCWETVRELAASGLLLTGSREDLSEKLRRVRFRHHKAGYLARARELFSATGKLRVRQTLGRFTSPLDMREWLVENIKGMGYKEASHFMRNIGFGDDIAILDRHILKNLKRLGVLRTVPASLTRKRYLEIEGKMKRFAASSGIPLSHLDLLLWANETGEIFK